MFLITNLSREVDFQVIENSAHSKTGPHEGQKNTGTDDGNLENSALTSSNNEVGKLQKRNILDGKDLPDDLPLDNIVLYHKTEEGVYYIGKKTEVPCNLYVTECVDDEIDTTTLKKCELVNIEVVYETGAVQETDDKHTLTSVFGSERSIKRMKQREIHGYLKSANIKSETKSRLLPPISANWTTFANIWQLHEIFPKDMLESFAKIDLEELELEKEMLKIDSNFKSRYITLGYKATEEELEYKTKFLVCDAIIKTLNHKFVTSKMFDGTEYEKWGQVLSQDIEDKKLTKMAREKLLVKLYIMIMQICNGRVQLANLPTFGLAFDKIFNYFSLIGCAFDEKKFEFVFRKRNL